ncbi:MAG: hypothetical protein JNN05_05680, partial [Candidatus Omnitrophica bacterium]|nr:hypothetical protein [Candidatus Omnitrophota bacterium]
MVPRRDQGLECLISPESRLRDDGLNGPRDIRPSLKNSLQNLNGKRRPLSFEDWIGQRKGSANNNVTTNQYDERQMLLTVTDANMPDPGITQYDYDAN